MLCASFIFYSFHYYYSRDFLPCVFRPRLSPLILLILYTNTWEGLCVISQVAPLVASKKSPIPPGEAQMSFSLKMLWEERVARRADCKWVLKSGDPGFRSLLPSLQDVGKQAAATRGTLQMSAPSVVTTAQWHGYTLIPIYKWGDEDKEVNY